MAEVMLTVAVEFSAHPSYLEHKVYKYVNDSIWIYIFPKKPRTLTIYLTEQYHQFRTLNKNAQQKNYLFTTNVFCQKNSCIICKHLRC